MLPMYPHDWQARKLETFIDANWECAHCGVTYGTLKISRRTGILFPVLLHAAHKHNDIDNPQPELIALCPSCHMKYDRQHHETRRKSNPRRPGYEVVTIQRLATELSYVGLFLSLDRESGRVSWECAGLQGEANDMKPEEATPGLPVIWWRSVSPREGYVQPIEAEQVWKREQEAIA
jgi:hypothetical protein